MQYNKYLHKNVIQYNKYRKKGIKMLEKLFTEAYNSALEIIETAKLKQGNILVVGCSTSEIVGDKITFTEKKPDFEWWITSDMMQ